MPKVPSKARGHFDKLDDGKVRCKLCSVVLVTGGGTSNMLAHLKRKHPGTMDVTETVPPLNQENASTSDNIQNVNNLSGCDVRNINRSLTLMLATDYQPFSIVEDKGFKNFVHEINPNYKIPDKRTVRYEIMPAIYKEAKDSLKLMLSQVNNVSITTDVWTNQAMESYITVTGHFFYEDKLRSCILSTTNIQDSHTSENLKDIVIKILIEWEIRDKIVCITTDNGANMIRMARLLGIRHMPCFAHTLNLVVDDSLSSEDLVNLIDKCKKIVKYFRKSNVATVTLQKEQREFNPNNEPLKLIQDISTRWNSTYYMINRILKLIDFLTAAQRKLPQSPPIITPDEETILKDVVLLLDVFEQATKMISGDQYPTSALIIPVVYGLFDNIQTLEPKVCTTIGKFFCQKLKKKMCERLLGYETRTVCRISTVLHPVFRNSFRQPENQLAAKEAVKAEINNIIRINQRSEQDPVPSTSQCNTIPSRPNLFNFLLQNRTDTTINTSATAINLFKMYSETECSRNDHDWSTVVEFWRFNKHLKPLNEIAYKYLTVPATSVRSERVFSATGYILNDRRSMLRNDAVEMLCFLNQNHQLLQPK